MAKTRRDPIFGVRILLVTCVVLTPSLFDLAAVKPFDIVKVTTVLFFGWLALGLWVASVATGQARPRRFTMGYLAGAYLAVATVATIFSPTKPTSLIGWYGRHHGWITILAYVVIFYLIATVYRQRRDRAHELIYAMGAGAVVLTIYILMQKLGIDPIDWARPSGEVPGQPYFGTMGNANFAGGYLGLTAPWLYLAFMRSRQRWQRGAIVVWGLVQTYALWLTSARNGLVALGFALGAFLFIHRKRVPLFVKAGAIAAALAAVVVAVLIIWHPGSARPPAAFRNVDILRNQTIQVRGYWWLAALEMGIHRPVQGWGPDTFVTVYPRFLEREAAKLGDAETADKPHNVFVEHIAHTGFLGFGAYVALLSVAFRRAFQRSRGATRNEQALIPTLVAILAGYIGQAFFSIDVTAIALVGWVTLGVIAAVADPPDAPARAAANVSRRAKNRVIAGVAIVLACVLAGVSLAPLRADHESRAAQRLANDDAVFEEVIEHHDSSVAFNPLVPQYHALTAAYLTGEAKETENTTERDELLEEALEHFREAERIHPNYHGWKMAVAEAMGEVAAVGGTASFDDAFDKFAEARRLAPYDWRVLVNRGDVYNLRATAEENPEDLCRALDDYHAAEKLRPQAALAMTGIGRTFARLGDLDRASLLLRRAAKLDAVSDFPDRLLEEVRKLQRRDEPPELVECR